MICYFDPSSNFLTGVPQPLMERVAAEREEQANQAFGVRFEGFGPGWVNVNITGIRDPFSGNPGRLPEVLQFLASESIVCVDVEPRDIAKLYGRLDPMSVAIARGLESGHPQIARLFSRVRPDEISGNIDAAMSIVMADGSSDPFVSEQEKCDAALDLSLLGVKVGEEDAWEAYFNTEAARDALGPQPEPEREVSEDFQGRYSNSEEYIDPFDPRYYDDDNGGN